MTSDQPRPISPDDVPAFLRRLTAHWLFAGVPPPVMDPLLTAVDVLRVLPGEVIFREGDPADGLYIVATGTIRVVVAAPGGRTVLTTLGPDAIFGEMGVLDGQPRSGTAIAEDLGALYFLPTDPFINLLVRSGRVTSRLLVLLAKRLRLTNGRIRDLPLREGRTAAPVMLERSSLTDLSDRTRTVPNRPDPARDPHVA